MVSSASFVEARRVSGENDDRAQKAGVGADPKGLRAHLGDCDFLRSITARPSLNTIHLAAYGDLKRAGDCRYWQPAAPVPLHMRKV